MIISGVFIYKCIRAFIQIYMCYYLIVAEKVDLLFKKRGGEMGEMTIQR